MKPKYAIAALAAAGITALGGTAAVAATASHKPATATVTVTPVSGKPQSWVRGTAKPVRGAPVVVGNAHGDTTAR